MNIADFPDTEDEMGFIRAVQANHDDDAPRLIYADWLEERDMNAYVLREQVRRKNIAHWFGFRRKIKLLRYLSLLDTRRQICDYIHTPRWGFLEYLICPLEWLQDRNNDIMFYHPIREVYFLDYDVAKVKTFLEKAKVSYPSVKFFHY